MRYLLLVSVLVLLLAAGCGQTKKKEPLALEQIPEEVMKVAREKLPDVKFDRAAREANGDYELVGKDKKGKVREIDISPAGQVTQIE
jgi:hypothetical protein